MNLRAIMKIVLNRKWAFPFLYGILALVVIISMTSGGMGVSVDSERYLITADQLRHLDFESAFKTILPHSPIFYPLTVALVQISGLAQGADAARIISILSFVISVIATFYLGLQIQGKSTAHAASLSWIVFAPLIYAFSYCWSETLYILLSLLFFLTLILFLKSPREKEIRYLVIGALLAGLGFITRFMGVALIVTGVLVLVFLRQHDRISKKFKEVLIFGVVAFIPMFINLIVPLLFFHLPSRESVPAGLSFFGQLDSFFVTIYRDFLSFNLSYDHYVFFHSAILGKSFFESHLWGFDVIILLCLLIFLVAFIRSIYSSASFRYSLHPQISMLVYCIFYSLLLIVVTWRIAVDPIGTRFVLPLYPFIILLIFSGIFRVFPEFTQRKLKLVFLGIAILGTFLFWEIQLISTSGIYKGVRSGDFPAMEQPGNRNRTSLNYLKKHLTSANVVLSNIPDKLTFIWPRGIPYQSASKLDFLLSQDPRAFADSLVYILFCANDRDMNPLVMEFEGVVPSVYTIHLLPEREQYQIIEGYLTSRKLAYRKVVFGHDYIYRLSLREGIKNP
jgi:4-amino-4-deoxy-L-arabinose transferase-like glycosyltransferase